jgi:hypothetical protein
VSIGRDRRETDEPENPTWSARSSGCRGSHQAARFLGLEGTNGKNVTERPHLNDDKSPLIDLMICFVCDETMKIEKSVPDPDGHDTIQYRCRRCARIELVRLFRRNRDA